MNGKVLQMQQKGGGGEEEEEEEEAEAGFQTPTFRGRQSPHRQHPCLSIPVHKGSGTATGHCRGQGMKIFPHPGRFCGRGGSGGRRGQGRVS